MKYSLKKRHLKDTLIYLFILKDRRGWVEGEHPHRSKGKGGDGSCGIGTRDTASLNQDRRAAKKEGGRNREEEENQGR